MKLYTNKNDWGEMKWYRREPDGHVEYLGKYYTYETVAKDFVKGTEIFYEPKNKLDLTGEYIHRKLDAIRDFDWNLWMPTIVLWIITVFYVAISILYWLISFGVIKN